MLVSSIFDKQRFLNNRSCDKLANLVKMGKGKEIPLEVRKIILKLYLEHKTYREIGELIGKSHSSVYKIIKKYINTGDLPPKPRSGRPKMLSSRQERSIVSKIKANPHLSAPKIAAALENTENVSVSTQTVRNTLKHAGYHGRSTRKKPFICKRNAIKRLEFAKKHINQPDEFWKNVVFTDESKYNIFGSDGRRMVWRKPNTEFQFKNINATVKHGGGNVMVWGCIGASGVGELVFIDGIMDKTVYLNILRNNLDKSVEKMGLDKRSFYFQQDNDPKHKSKLVMEWLLYRVPHQLHSPPQSPDMNPIEHVWELLEKRIRVHNITSKDSLKQALITEWNKITPQEIEKLVLSMKNRLQAVIDAKGYQTKY